MKQKPAKRGARAWAIAIPAGILLLLLLAAFLIGNGGASAFRDDVDAILAAPRSEELGELSFADDGSAVVRLYKNDLYVLADESGVLPGLRRQMRDRFGDLDFGIRLAGGKMRVCISQRVLGLVPVSMQIVTSLSWDGTGRERSSRQPDGAAEIALAGQRARGLPRGPYRDRAHAGSRGRIS